MNVHTISSKGTQRHLTATTMRLGARSQKARSLTEVGGALQNSDSAPVQLQLPTDLNEPNWFRASATKNTKEKKKCLVTYRRHAE